MCMYISIMHIDVISYVLIYLVIDAQYLVLQFETIGILERRELKMTNLLYL